MSRPGYFFATVVLLSASLSGCCDRAADRAVLDEQTDFYCAGNGAVTYAAWSECGLMKVCIDQRTGKKNGSQFAAQGGKLRSKALYHLGKEVGGWTAYDAEGNAQAEEGGYQSPHLEAGKR